MSYKQPNSLSSMDTAVKFPRKKDKKIVASFIYRIFKYLPSSKMAKYKLLSDIAWITQRMANELSWSAQGFTLADHPATNLRFDFIKRKLSKKQRILDIGCGSGELTSLISGFCQEIVGVDHNKIHVDNANKKYGSDKTKFIYGDAFKFLNENSAVDVLICCHILEHLDTPTEFLKQAWNYCDLIYVEVPDFERSESDLTRLALGLPAHFSDADHIYEFTRDNMYDLFKQSNCHVIDEQFRFGIMSFWIAPLSV